VPGTSRIRVLPESDGAVQSPVWRSNNSEMPGTAAARPTRSAAAAGPASRPEPGPSQAEFEAQVQMQLQVAYESGVREGGAAAREKLEGEVRRAVEQLAVSAAEVVASRADALRRAEADVVHLSIEIARRVLHRELSVDPAALGALVRAALEKLANQRVCRVRVHADQEELVRATLAQLGRGSEIDVISDGTQERGSAIFETESSSLDASIDTQLREIERGLADRLQERS
jgi:flagellar assembly protein FliH